MKNLQVEIGSNNLASSIDHICAFYPSLVNQSQNYWELGDPDCPSPYSQSLKDIDSAIGQLKRLRKEMQELSRHVHEWNEDDYCIHCNADGRA